MLEALIWIGAAGLLAGAFILADHWLGQYSNIYKPRDRHPELWP
jgi:hypothetical protein